MVGEEKRRRVKQWRHRFSISTEGNVRGVPCTFIRFLEVTSRPAWSILRKRCTVIVNMQEPNIGFDSFACCTAH